MFSKAHPRWYQLHILIIPFIVLVVTSFRLPVFVTCPLIQTSPGTLQLWKVERYLKILLKQGLKIKKTSKEKQEEHVVPQPDRRQKLWNGFIRQGVKIKPRIQWWTQIHRRTNGNRRALLLFFCKHCQDNIPNKQRCYFSLCTLSRLEPFPPPQLCTIHTLNAPKRCCWWRNCRRCTKTVSHLFVI